MSRPDDRARVKARFDHPEDRLRIPWSYIDARELAAACRLGIERDGLGCEPLSIAANGSAPSILRGSPFAASRRA